MVSREDNMQKKNILIAILSIAILLLVPFTSISGASVGGLSNKVGIVEESNPVIPYHLFDELIELINQLLVDGKEIPYIVDICNEALEMINPIIQKEIFEGICALLELLCLSFGVAVIFLLMLAQAYRDSGQPEIAIIFEALAFPCVIIVTLFLGIAVILFCDFVWDSNQEINILKDIIDLNPQINPESISEIDISAFTEFFKSYEVNGCPCMYE
jgi:hypothetical protein